MALRDRIFDFRPCRQYERTSAARVPPGVKVSSHASVSPPAAWLCDAYATTAPAARDLRQTCGGGRPKRWNEALECPVRVVSEGQILYRSPVQRVPAPTEVARRLAALRAALARFGYERAILFGSGARGDMHEASDLDVLVVRRTDLPFVERARALLEMLPSGLAVDVVVYTPEEFARLTSDPRGLVASALAEGVEL
jgi:predicted nucleotidyltransferase